MIGASPQIAETPFPVASTGATLLVEATGLYRRYGSVVALEDARFELRRGEVMALIGENGAGKSTLVKILAGLVARDAGSIRIDGRDVPLQSPAASRQAGIAVVQQELSLVAPLSVAENVALGSDLPGLWTAGRLVRRARPFLEDVGLPLLDPSVAVGSLALAERQLVEIARMLARDARILILDEPTAALSDVEIVRVKQVVRNLVSEGRSVIYVTHRLGEVLDIADRVTVFRNGHSSEPVDVGSLTISTLVERMLGRRLDEMYPVRSSGIGEPVLTVDAVRAEGLTEPVSLVVHAGEILGLAGQLGGGMRPLIRAIAGVEPMRGGAIAIRDRRLGDHSLRSAIAAGIAFCSDDRKLDGIFSVRSVVENLTAPSLSRVSPRGWISNGREKRLAAELGALFQIDERRFRSPVGDLSGGNQQKVALAKWLGTQPRVLLVEEPTRGVDIGARAEIYAHLRHLAEDGLAIAFASSDLPEVQGLSDTIATFYRGRLVRLAPAGEFAAEAVLHDVTHGVAGTAEVAR